jgi:hypothetical protein
VLNGKRSVRLWLYCWVPRFEFGWGRDFADLAACEKVSGGERPTMSEIHYFPRYSQRENFVTNNTLLLLLRLYQYSRYKFQSFMERLCADEPRVQLSTSWLHFQQQKATGKSVLDGFISQDSIKIAVETKLGGSFDSLQLENHMAVFKNEQHKLLIMLNPTDVADSQISSIRKNALSKNIQVVHTSFEKIINNARKCLSEHDEEMRALVDDYESFCSEMELLPFDKYLVFVPPCGVSFGDNLEFKLYYCPTTWTRRKTRYLGVYANKAVRAIGRVAKIVASDVNLEKKKVTVQDGVAHLTVDEEKRILGATKNAKEHGWDVSTGHKFYLCDRLSETEFRKESPGGIQGHRYLDLREFLGPDIPDDEKQLASRLRECAWQ